MHAFSFIDELLYNKLSLSVRVDEHSNKPQLVFTRLWDFEQDPHGPVKVYSREEREEYMLKRRVN
jgi:hypothetical protein